MENAGYFTKVSFNEAAISDAASSGWKQHEYELIKTDTELFESSGQCGSGNEETWFAFDPFCIWSGWVPLLCSDWNKSLKDLSGSSYD